jgi:OFA family oxalate/formate antiporter-like MFS transporter
MRPMMHVRTQPPIKRHSDPNRFVIAVAGFAMQLAFGSVYGWSVFLNPLRDLYGASKLGVGLTFTITLAVLGITAGFGGFLQSRFGPRTVATAAGLFYGGGVLLSGLAPSLPALYLTYGLIGGVGLGLGYIVPLAVLIRWFPDKRGFITGLTVAGFGLGAFIASPLATELIRGRGVQHAFFVLGLAYLAIVVAAAQALHAAPDDYAPPGWTPARRTSPATARNYALSEAVRTPLWAVLWLILALNVSAGAALLSVAAPLAQELT